MPSSTLINPCPSCGRMKDTQLYFCWDCYAREVGITPTHDEDGRIKLRCPAGHGEFWYPVGDKGKCPCCGNTCNVFEGVKAKSLLTMLRKHCGPLLKEFLQIFGGLNAVRSLPDGIKLRQPRYDILLIKENFIQGIRDRYTVQALIQWPGQFQESIRALQALGIVCEPGERLFSLRLKSNQRELRTFCEGGYWSIGVSWMSTAQLIAYMLQQCACGPHARYGLEVEFDCESWVRLHAPTAQSKRFSFSPIGRDGQGQGEVRSIPHNDFSETAKSLLIYFNNAQEQRKAAHQERDSIALEQAALGLIMEEKPRKMPNGLHLHHPVSPTIYKALQWLAVYWNQRNDDAKMMLKRRLKQGYGDLNGARSSGICKEDGKFDEFRALNGPSGEHQEKELQACLELMGKVLERPTFPQGKPEYTSEAFDHAKAWIKTYQGEVASV